MNTPSPRNGLRVLLTAVLLVWPGAQWPATAEDEDPLPTPTVNPELLKNKIKKIEATANLNQETKEKLTEFYRRALTTLEKAGANQGDAEIFAQAAKTAPEEIRKLRQAIANMEQVSADKGLKISDKTPMAELEQQLLKERGDLMTVETRLANLKKKHELEISRPTLARSSLSEAKQQQDEITAELNAPTPTGESAEVTEARRWALETRVLELSAEIRRLNEELLSHQIRLDLLNTQLEKTSLDTVFVRDHVRLLEQTLTKHHLLEAEEAHQQAEAIQEELKGGHPMVREMAERNAALTEELAQLAADAKSVSTKSNSIRDQATRIEDELRTVKEKISIAGLSQALGSVLMEQRRALPDITTLRREAWERESRIAELGLRQIQLGEERRALRGLEDYVANTTADLPAEEAEGIHLELRDLAAKRRELVAKANDAGTFSLRALGEMDLGQRELMDAVESFNEYLATRLLWIRSTAPADLELLQGVPQDVMRLLSPSNWVRAGRDLLQALHQYPPSGLLLLVLLALVFLRRRFLKSVTTSAEKIGRIRTDRFSYTLQALAFTGLASAPLPILLLAIGWVLNFNIEAAVFSNALATALMRVAPDYLILQFFTDVCYKHGLAARHFRWQVDAVSKARRQFRWLMAVFVSASFVTVFSINIDSLSLGGGLAMLAVLTGIGSIGVFVFRFFSPRGGALRDVMENRPNDLLARLRPVWFTFLVAIAPILMGLVLAGYLYTGGTICANLINTVWLIFGLVLTRGLVVRWLLLVSRRLAYQAALERRNVARAAREAAEKSCENVVVADDSIPEIEESEVDLAALDADSRKLLSTAMVFAAIIGLWVIWSRVLPAFGILEEVSLWSYARVVEGVEQRVPVTLADLALAIIIGIATVTAARGLPAFLEFILLQRISMTAGARYTATTLLRYFIVGVGAVLFFGILGASWSKIQWLVAALGVGIGFGLQEIVANFISGLIILFERPIRIGDTVTVGETTGVVSRIKIRATTITNWDRQELLVPNKEFITTRLLNWSLSDPIVRVRIPVGITYSSDVPKAMALMKETAKKHDNVLENPAPSVTFENFGDNALNLFLRAFLPSMDNRIQTISELHEAILRKFNEAGIVIAFPQRDVHLDTSQPLDVRLRRDDERRE